METNGNQWSRLFFVRGRSDFIIKYVHLRKHWANGSQISNRAEHGSSIGCTSAWYTDGRGFDPHVLQHSFVEFGHEIIFYSHYLPSTDSRRAVVSYWRKNMHLVVVNCLGGLPRNSVARLTDRPCQK